MKKYIVTILAVLMLFSAMLIPSAFAASKPLAEIYWISTSNGGVGPGGSASIQSYLNDMTYNAKRYANTRAYYIRRTMNDDVVFAVVSHGAPGRIYGANNPNAQTVSAKIVKNDDDNFSLQAKFSSGAFSNMKFAYYGACQTARTSSTYGNLLTYTTSTLGAKSALGFYNNVLNTTATYYEEQLFKRFSWGYTVYNADYYAKLATYNNYGYHGEVDSAIPYGSSSTTLN